jgi:CheY-like chemotaxis protein
LTTRSADDAVFIEVRDTGVGMDAAMRSRLFEPFFSTKESGQGLGTSIIYGIVTRHKGEIDVSTTLGEGTTFVVKLPELDCAGAVESELEPELQAVSHSSAARILLIDDEHMVLETHAEVLRRGGHEVVPVGDGQAALDLLESEEFDVVITDLSMEGLSGLDVARGVKAWNGSMPVILLSGWAMQQSEDRIREAGVDRVLLKPCPIKDLLAAVQQVVRVPAGV